MYEEFEVPLEAGTLCESQHIFFRVEAFGDPGLIGNDKHEEPCIIQQLDRRLGTIDPAKNERANRRTRHRD